MAHFIGYTRGQRGEASRLGGKKSGLSAQGRGWNIGGEIRLGYQEDKEKDLLRMYIDGGSSSTSNILSFVVEEGMTKKEMISSIIKQLKAQK